MKVVPITVQSSMVAEMPDLQSGKPGLISGDTLVTDADWVNGYNRC